MSRFSHQTILVQQSPSTSGLAIAGLIFAILGWFTCGLLCIPGAFLCLLALFTRGPKGAAIAGLIVGFPGTMFFIFFGLSMIMGILGVGAVATTAVLDSQSSQGQTQSKPDVDQDWKREENPSVDSVPDFTVEPRDELEVNSPTEDQQTQVPMTSATSRDEKSATPQKPAVDQPDFQFEALNPTTVEAAIWRTWMTADGRYKVEAKFVSFSGGKVKLEKKDGVTVNVPVELLCAADQQFLKERNQD